MKGIMTTEMRAITQNKLLINNVISNMNEITRLEKEKHSLNIKNCKLKMELLYGKCTKYN